MSAENINYAQFTLGLRAFAFDTWRTQVAAGHLTEAGLFALRDRLLGGEFEPGPDRELLLLDVVAAVCGLRGVDPGSIEWGGPRPPDDASGLEYPPEPL